MKEYFCGWYFKLQGEKTLAFIPAFHKSKANSSCSIQIITDNGSWNTIFQFEQFIKQKDSFMIDINENHFGFDGIKLNIQTENISIKGTVSFGQFNPIKYDIMGPFKYIPLMQCRHSVVSMLHSISGNIEINGEVYTFDNDFGYIEGDRGYSFPSVYLWTQCLYKTNSVMLSVADIPFGLFHFTGIIGVLLIDGKEYRIATYLGAKAVKIENGEAIIKQKNQKLSVKLLEKHAHPLLAPVSGDMVRTIRESASCVAQYKFEIDGKTILDFESNKSSFEYEYLK